MTDVQITPNFNLKEFLKEGDSPPNRVQVENLRRLAWALQVIRDLIGKPIIITSGYRSQKHNDQVGGAPNSYHRKGMAADIVVVDMGAKALQHYLRNWSGGMGMYKEFTHFDCGPKRRWI